ncbi:type I-E CRISPR-associated protein Cas6/Cse3/CasE [Nocardiopsis aegyptia]|uniref:CRISPR system Cascade subunit CasE n=1 Tax=Nocardiopsis aegyptia TaxID=220378 RepID=A0A7Z0EJK9_9ACTN|nr:type I-E CRISPR-associated protein Cas6/Cse3/CasE [Nocardiopsis aegyptia]NYJ32811.1 CRISPR system Cascade subunit CasE [Nocardiopsis aegyptia]
MPVQLTKIDLDDRDRNVRRSTAGDQHRILMSLVSDSLGGQKVDSPRHKAGLLFRMEETRAGRHMLVQTRCELNLERLPSGFRPAGVKDLTPLLKHLNEGDIVRYRIAGCPMKRLGKSSRPREMWKQNGQRLSSGAHELPLIGEAADAWWKNRAEQNGLGLLSSYATRVEERVDNKGDRGVRMPAVRFDGLARVRDAEAVRTAVLNGIGRGKTFGCGLLSLAYPGGR